MIRRLDIWWDGRIVGQVMQNRHGELGFGYAAAWVADESAPALSAFLPKRLAPYSRAKCRPFFGGLLPDESQRVAAAAALGVSPANDFALLDRLGGDVAGALQLLPAGISPPTSAGDAATVPLDNDELLAILDELPSRPLLAGQGELRLSLAGAQSKLPVVLVSGAIALPRPGQPTTHILKPRIARFDFTTENEAFAMRLAAAAGLDAAPVEARLAGGIPYLLVQRYDRAIVPDAGLQRIHQEDFCQALGIPPERKYASEGGPVFKDCFELVRRVSARPGADVGKLLDAAIFNLVIGNADAHGKNFSILYTRNGARLAPLYDLLATVAYPQLSKTLAMKIGKRAELAGIDGKAWDGFAKDAGLGLPFVRRRVVELCGVLLAQAARTAATLQAPGFDNAALDTLAQMVRDRAERCSRTFAR